MALAGELRQRIEEAANRLAGEAVLASPGRDEGLIPAYSLLSELLDALAGQPPEMRAPVEAVRKRLDQRLDAGLPFDEESLGAVLRLVQWLPNAIEALAAEKPVPQMAAPTKPSEAVNDAGGAAAAAGERTQVEELLNLNAEENRELLTEFYAEAAEHLQQIEASMLVLDGRPDDPEALSAVFRSFHTIKGNAGFLGLRPMHLLAHEVETLLDLARNHELAVTAAVVTEVLRSRDALQALNNQIAAALHHGTAPSVIVPVGPIMVSVRALATATPAKAEVAPVVPLTPAAPAVEAPRSEVAAPSAPAPSPLAATAAQAAAPAASATAATTVRVSTEKLDTLMDVVGELVIVYSQLAETARTYGAKAPPLPGNVAQLNRITKELQDTAMSVRMIPIQPTFQKMERLARDLAQSCGKQVTFSTRGGDTELDRTMVEDIADPLVHMMRNALDHGIEPEAERVAKGKLGSGAIELRAFHQGSTVIIELRDDGRGLDPDKILAKARRQGLVPEGTQPTIEEIQNYIFLPGFSTAEKVTALSGRGVGMDVVKRNVEKLRGKIEISSVLGKGTTFKIKLPLTMAIIDGLVVRVGEDRFILPTTSVQRALRPRRESIITVRGSGEVLDLNGKLIPLHRLHQHFGIPARAQEPWEGILVIVETSGRPCALLVDEMISKQEVVIKNLGGYLQSLAGNSGVAGGAILGDGQIALILDPGAMLRAA